MRTHKANTGPVVTDIAGITIGQLRTYAIPYDDDMQESYLTLTTSNVFPGIIHSSPHSPELDLMRKVVV